MNAWKPFVVVAALSLAACGAPPNAVGPTGGTITAPSESNAHGATLTVPPNAVSQTIMIDISVDAMPGTLPNAGQPVSSVLRYAPEGTTFTTPATITIPTTATAAAIFTRSAGGDWTQVEGATFDAAHSSISAPVTHLGEFVAMSAPFACANTIPSTNFCSAEGCSFAPVSLPSCDDSGGTYDFYNPDYCSSQLTLFVVAAGWCNPCMQEAPMIEDLITANPDYAGKVRVVSVIFQNPDYSTPTTAFCNIWKNRYGLTSHMVIDPNGLTQMYYPGMAFPANILVNSQGQIVYRAYGTSAGLQELRDAIEQNVH